MSQSVISIEEIWNKKKKNEKKRNRKKMNQRQRIRSKKNKETERIKKMIQVG